MKAPQHLSHKPIIAVNDYDKILVLSNKAPRLTTFEFIYKNYIHE